MNTALTLNRHSLELYSCTRMKYSKEAAFKQVVFLFGFNYAARHEQVMAYHSNKVLLLSVRTAFTEERKALLCDSQE